MDIESVEDTMWRLKDARIVIVVGEWLRTRSLSRAKAISNKTLSDVGWNKGKRVLEVFPEKDKHPRRVADWCDFELIGRPDTKFEVLTHSPVIPNRIGEYISRGKLKVSDAVVLVLSNSCYSIDRISYYDEEGVLVNWPVGFFY